MLLNNAVYGISCQSVLPFLELFTLLIVTIIFNLKLEHTGFQKAVLCIINIFTSVKFSHTVMSDSLWPHDPQHTRPPCPSPAPGVYPNPCPLSCWFHPTISSAVFPFSSCPESFPASGSFRMSQLFASDGPNIGVSASTSVLPMNTQDWSLGWTGWTSLQSKGLSRVLSTSKASILWHSAFFIVQQSHPYMTIVKTIALTRQTFMAK